MTAIKICGLTQPEHVKHCITLGVEFVGFVAYPASPRHVDLEQYRQLTHLLSAPTQSVLVTVDIENTYLDAYIAAYKPDYIQCHGGESEARLVEIGTRYNCRIIKAISDTAQATLYKNSATYLLIDAKPAAGELPGGNARTADWASLKNFSSPLPWFLSGGLTPQNVQEALDRTSADMIDVSSGVERQRGVKDLALIEEFVRNVRQSS